MLDLKFRAWDGEMMDYNVTIFNGVFIDCNNANEDVFFSWHDPANQIAIMQYTGFLDKNKKEIYVGDIIAPFNKALGPHKIIFSEGSFCIENSIGVWGTLKRAFDISHFNTDIEVIGNIYENPELL